MRNWKHFCRPQSRDSRMEKEWALPAAVEGKEVKWEQACGE